MYFIGVSSSNHASHFIAKMVDKVTPSRGETSQNPPEGGRLTVNRKSLNPPVSKPKKKKKCGLKITLSQIHRLVREIM